VGDGAVGLCGVMAARRCGAEQIILLGRHPDRVALGKAFGATAYLPATSRSSPARARALVGQPDRFAREGARVMVFDIGTARGEEQPA
jgi:threonine dehydrogenase-like Zn-dependent dehydrogenase